MVSNFAETFHGSAKSKNKQVAKKTKMFIPFSYWISVMSSGRKDRVGTALFLRETQYEIKRSRI